MTKHIMGIKNPLFKSSPKKSIIICIFLSVIAGISLLIGFSSSINPLDARLKRTNGYSSGDDIQGDFRIIVEGPENLTSVKIFFNDTEVYQTTDHDFSWAFNTDNYTLGVTNITVQGWDTQNTLYQWSTVVNFVSSDVNTPIFVILGGIGVLSAIIGLYSYKKQKKAEKAPPPQKSDVDIKLDKDLL